MNYSIIIPHHNIPRLLQRLLDSIPQRDDTEIIVVDDNSDPDIVDFNRFPGRGRSDVKVIFDKKGGFGGYARNIGLSVAKGKWILFADSDDYFNYCLNDVLDEYKDSDADIIFFKANSVDTDSYVSTFRSTELNGLIDLYETNPSRTLMELRYKFGEPWCKFVKRSVIEKNNIRFEERSIHNDTAFSYLVGHYAKKALVDQRALYCVTVRKGSVSQVLSEHKILETIDNFGSSSMFFRKNNIPVSEERHFKELYLLKKDYPEIYLKAKEILKGQGYTD